MSVLRIVVWRKIGYGPDEIASNFGHVSLAQVHAALAYYCANQAEVDAEIEAEERLDQELAKQHPRKPKCA